MINFWLKAIAIAMIVVPKMYAAGSSMDARKDSHVMILGSPAGFYGYFGNSARLSILVDSQVAIEAGFGTYESNFFGSSRTTYDVGDASVRYFVGNSFNVTFGIERRQTRMNHAPNRFLDDGQDGVRSYSIDYGPRFGIGNLWQFGRFVLGCEWATLFAAASKGEIDIKSRSTQTSDEEATTHDTHDNQRGANFGFTQLFVGFAF